MNGSVQSDRTPAPASEHFDVLIIGAGISGIGAAHHLKEQCPGKSFLILESKESFGGTWHTHTYPGIRSDSDLYTFGYRFKPWTGKPIAEGQMILDYLGDVIAEDGTDAHIRYHHRVERAVWSSDDACWTLDVLRTDTDERFRVSAHFLWMCQGYYRHDEGYTPDFPGLEDYQGRIVHPQTWPEDLEYKDKTVIVIGSGATAATLIPNMSDDCAHITMVQRSPTYFWTGENRNELADMLRSLDLPEEWVHEIVRRKLLQEQKDIHMLAKEHPEFIRGELMKLAREHLGEDFDIDTHFNPSYRPWQQRLAYVPDGDLFAAIRSGKVSVVTDHIDRFTQTGLLLKSGQHIDADIVITATGFNLSVFGDIPCIVDGEAVDFSKCWSYRGVMLSGLPNSAAVFGYLRTSWTMRVDLIGDFVCRLLNTMDAKGARICLPTLRPQDQGMTPRPWISEHDFNAGYLQRSVHLLPKQGDHEPWVFVQDYYEEKESLPNADLEDGALVYR